MMKNIKKTLIVPLITLSLALWACEEPIRLQNFDAEAWKADKKACKNIRKQWIQSLLFQKSTLKGKSRLQILALLGKPDAQELYERGQRFYYYFWDKGVQCIGKNDLKSTKFIKLRISAIGRVTEIIVNPIIILKP
jgi:outer membrane protein assembly factor BamE (lipoprotein component of BamABCDE complex)